MHKCLDIYAQICTIVSTESTEGKEGTESTGKIMERIVGTYIFDPRMTAGKMIFLTGPRQVGKTTFAQMWLKSSGTGTKETYFNWDDPSVLLEYKRNPLWFKNIVEERFKKDPVPMVFDEIHKNKHWRNILKGFFDTNKDRMQLLVTGSGRFDTYQRSGDSLLGRYFSYRMFPIGLPEAVGDFSCILNDGEVFANGGKFAKILRDAKVKQADEGLELLRKFGGFPEPFLRGEEAFHRRWQKDYKTLIAREDVRDLSQIQDIKGVEVLIEVLPTKVGSPLSIRSLSDDLAYNQRTIARWIDVLGALYLVFTLRPWHRKITRAIKKETKLYFYDWSLLTDEGTRFENLIAVSLSRMAARLTEKGLGEYEIRYIRDREKREVDFVMVKDDIPICLIEAKEGSREISKNGRYYSDKLGIPFYQIVNRAERVEEYPGNCFIIPAVNFLMLTG